MSAVVKTIWEYKVNEDHLDAFLKAYRPEGDWAQLFKKCAGFLGTELHRDAGVKNRYVTIDFWQSIDTLESMKQIIGTEYQLLDKICEDYTLSENHIGIFEEII